jgi:hypothetical protein
MNATLTPEAKEALRKTIRGLRERLLVDIREAAESTYRLSIKIESAALAEAPRIRRARLESWLDEQVRAELHAAAKAKGALEGGKGKGKGKTKGQTKDRATRAGKASSSKTAADPSRLRERFLRQAEKEAASTLLNRLVFLRHIEALGLQRPAVVTGGWSSQAYKELREFAPELTGDDTEGYGHLLELVFDELAHDLPGLFGDVGLTRLFPIPAPTLRAVIDALDDPELEPAWTDDTTLGWVYQFYNDPEREALDAKINDGGKIEPHEIASKTQMFTERYMVEWLLHNSLGQMWLAMCKKHGWRPDAEDVLAELDARRADWRKKRDAGEVTLEALMPIEPGLEDRWKYWVPQPMPDDAVEHAPASLRDLKLLDPACGSGHFLVVAFDLLAALYREESRHRAEAGSAEPWTDAQIAQWIIEDNLHGVDIDPRAVQLAAAGLWVKARQLSGHSSRQASRPPSSGVTLRRMNLVAPVLKLSGLPDDDPALLRLKQDLHREVGLDPTLTQRLVDALAGVDHLGSLLKVDAAIDEALTAQEHHLSANPAQGDLYSGFSSQPAQPTELRASVLERLERFLDAHAAEGDLGLRLEGEQLAAGVRFVRMMQRDQFDVVVMNPPYQGTSRMADADYVSRVYPRGKPDLFAAFLDASLAFARHHGVSAMVVMRGWMFLSQFEELRKALLHEHDVRVLGDIGTGAFSSRSMDDIISSVLTVIRRCPSLGTSVGLQAAPLADPRRDALKPMRRRAALLANEGRHEFDARAFEVIEGEPIVYWWPEELLTLYRRSQKLGDAATIRQGMATTNNLRFLRAPWEPGGTTLGVRWQPYIKGAAGDAWVEGTRDMVLWACAGLEVKVCNEHFYGSASRNIKNEKYYFRIGVAFSPIGSNFSARLHRVPSIIGHMGPSVYDIDPADALCLLNSSRARRILDSLNPGVHFEVGDVARLPFFTINGAREIAQRVVDAFDEASRHDEQSRQFRRPGPSAWRCVQRWAQQAVDRSDGAPLPTYEPEYDAPPPTAWLSFAVGVALGRFDANGEGTVGKAPNAALHEGILFLGEGCKRDSLAHPTCQGLNAFWAEHGPAVAEGESLAKWLRESFFSDVHRKMYENRPIYFPLSSAKRSFVAFVSIHRWTDTTLATLLADHLLPEQRALEGELDDLRTARHSTDKKQARQADKRFDQVKKLHEELTDFIAAVRQCAEKGPPPTDANCPKREVDAPYVMDLDDGVMINSAALWPLLEPQWKDPKKWWKELATAAGKKDYDWAHLSARYFPKRVDAKCRDDPSLGVAHHCFWKYHPAKAYAWELRLKDEIAPDFTIDEPGSDEARARYLADFPDEARATEEKERKRRERKGSKDQEDEQDEEPGGDDGPLFEERDVD